MTIDAATQEEINRFNDAVDEFAAEMKARSRELAMKGYRGWDDPDQYERILQMRMQHAAVAEEEEVDAANLAMILWSLRRQRSAMLTGSTLGATCEGGRRAGFGAAWAASRSAASVDVVLAASLYGRETLPGPLRGHRPGWGSLRVR
jgi:hypothetical protein